MKGFNQARQKEVLRQMTGYYLTSGEFAALRGVNLNSLRYYEKLGILLPSRVDPQTKYRYFRLEQLGTLDTILFFIEVGLPLKSFKSYVDGQGNLDQKRVLHDARQAMEGKIAAMKKRLAVTEFDLKNLEENRWCNEQQGVFSREIPERLLLIAPFAGHWEEPIRREQAAMALFQEAEARGLLPTFPAGILMENSSGKTGYAFYEQVLNAKAGGDVIRVGGGRFSSLQIELTAGMDMQDLVRRHFGKREGRRVMLQHIMSDTRCVASRIIEMQLPDEV